MQDATFRSRTLPYEFLSRFRTEEATVPPCFSLGAGCGGDRRTTQHLIDLNRVDASVEYRHLYCAHRDTVRNGSPTPLTPEFLPEGSNSYPLDYVCYSGGQLSSGEVVRSIGHWNPASQWEIFEVTAGRVILLVRGPLSGVVHLIEVGPGEPYFLVPGSWHTTYVTANYAAVWNIYPSDEEADRQDSEKYCLGGTPVQHSLLQTKLTELTIIGPRVDADGAVVVWDGTSAPYTDILGTKFDANPALVQQNIVRVTHQANSLELPFIRLASAVR